MAISTIGTDALAASAVTTTKLASGVPSRSQLPAGTVLQVQTATITAKVTTTSTSFVDTGLSVSITPTFSSSKFLITVAGQAGVNTNGLDRVYFYVNGLTSTAVGDAGAGGLRCTSVVCPRSSDTGGAGWAQSAIDIKLVDAPNTTATRTYSLQWRCNSASNSGALGSSANNDASSANTPTVMIVMEIAA